MAQRVTVHWDHGDAYEGEWLEQSQMPDGHGVYSYADGGWYEGQWKLGERHGHGREYRSQDL